MSLLSESSSRCRGSVSAALIVSIVVAPIWRSLTAQAAPIQSSDTALFVPLPTPGRVVAESVYKSIGVTRWTLSNGLVVFLKPTTSSYDEIQFQGESKGGLSGFSDADFPTAAYLPALIAWSGIGPYSQQQLKQRMSDEYVDEHVAVAKHWTFLAGKTKREDLRTAFQLMYLKMAAPRYDSAVAMSELEGQRKASRRDYNQQAMDRLENKSYDALYKHVRVWRFPDSTVAANLDPRKAVGLYRSLFADPHEMAFSFVGPFTLDAMKPLVERYLASLPVVPQPRAHPAMHSAAPGIIRKTIDMRGMQDIEEMMFHFSGPNGRDSQSSEILDIVHEILEGRLRNVLGGARVSIGGEGQDQNANEDDVAVMRIYVGFDAGAGVSHMIDSTVIATVDSLERTGPTLTEIDQAVEHLGLREKKSVVQQPLALGMAYLEHLPIAETGSPPATLKRTEIKALVQQTAQRVFDLHHYAVFTFLDPSYQSGNATP